MADRQEVIKTCEICGKEFYVDPKYQNIKKYCSTYCERKHQREQEAFKARIKDRTYRFKKTITLDGFIRSIKVRDFIAALYSGRCAICGWYATPYFETVSSNADYFSLARGCEMHHIKPVAEGGDESVDNLILLCPNCHTIANNGYLSPDELKKYQRQVPTYDEIDRFTWFVWPTLEDYSLNEKAEIASQKDMACYMLYGLGTHKKRGLADFFYKDGWIKSRDELQGFYRAADEAKTFEQPIDPPIRTCDEDLAVIKDSCEKRAANE